MNERELQEAVRCMCADLGLYHYHAYDSRRSEQGWPDSVIIGPRGIIFRELKSQSGQPTRDQKRVGYMLTAAGASWQVWRPADLLNGSIAAQLCQLAGIKNQVST